MAMVSLEERVATLEPKSHNSSENGKALRKCRSPGGNGALARLRTILSTMKRCDLG